MSVLMWLHIAGGIAALICGSAAIAARKGGRIHARAGAGFFVSMLVLGVSAAILGPLQSPAESPVAGVFTCYFVATSWVTARRRDGKTGVFEMIACVFAIGAAVIMAWGALAGAASTPVGRGPVFALAGIALFAGALDLIAVLRKKLTPAQRISRHLWRMCFAFFIATGSFFLGQQDVLPESIRGSPILVALAFAPFVAMAAGLLGVRSKRIATPG